MTLNGEMSVILRYFAEFVVYRAPTHGNPGYVHVAMTLTFDL